MGRGTQGWRVRRRPGQAVYKVVFWSPADRRQVELSTGETEPRRAAERAAQLFAEAQRSKRRFGRGSSCVAPLSTSEAGVTWLKSQIGLLDSKTLETYSIYLESHLAPAFPSLLDIAPLSVKEYSAERLKVVRAQTVRHELACLRCLVRWAVERRLLADEPLIPSLPRGAQGVQFATRRRAKPDELSRGEVEAFLAALPNETSRLGPVRPRFVLEYEMALRPSTLDRLSVPEHWRPGQTWLVLDASALKTRRPSRKPLTERAIQALEMAYQGPGLLFGEHDYREVVEKAAKAALAPEKAALFAAAHLRSAAITHLLDAGAPLTAAQAFADHKHATTTDRYVRASEKSLLDELRRQGRIVRPQ